MLREKLCYVDVTVNNLTCNYYEIFNEHLFHTKINWVQFSTLLSKRGKVFLRVCINCTVVPTHYHRVVRKSFITQSLMCLTLLDRKGKPLYVTTLTVPINEYELHGYGVFNTNSNTTFFSFCFITIGSFKEIQTFHTLFRIFFPCCKI